MLGYAVRNAAGQGEPRNSKLTVSIESVRIVGKRWMVSSFSSQLKHVSPATIRTLVGLVKIDSVLHKRSS